MKQIHIGSEHFLCPELLAHNEKMLMSDTEKYLGDLLSSDCSNQANLSAKAAKGMGLVAQIMSILSEVSLGVHYFEIAMLLREAMFINGVLTNVEVLYGLTEENYKELEKIDKILLQKILASHSKCANEAYYLELGKYPLRVTLA